MAIHSEHRRIDPKTAGAKRAAITRWASGSHRRDDCGGGCAGRKHVRKLQSCCFEELLIFRIGALSPCQRDHHVHVHQGSETRFANFAERTFDHGYTAIGSQGSSAILQDPNALLIIPIMQDVSQKVEVCVTQYPVIICIIRSELEGVVTFMRGPRG